MSDINNILINSIKFDDLGIKNPQIKGLSEGGISGASIHLITSDTNTKYILKIYPNDYYIKKKNRIFRELTVYKKLLEKFPYDKETTLPKPESIYSLCTLDTNGIDYPKLIAHGEIDGLKKPNYYIIISFVEGIVLSKSILPQNSNVWMGEINVSLFAMYLLKSIKYLNHIFDGKFLHYDLHPDNIYVVFKNNKLVKLTLIDFDLVDSNIPEFKKIETNMTQGEIIDMKLLQTFKSAESYIPFKTRALICYCFGDYNITPDSKLTIQHAVCGVASALIRYSNDIKNPDIRHWFVLVNALLFLSNKISHKKININLNKIYDSCFSEKHIDFDKFSFKSKTENTLSFLKNSISSSIGDGFSRSSMASGITKGKGGKKYKTKTIKRRRRTNKKKSTRKNNKKITKK
jgi:hypothetical protein